MAMRFHQGGHYIYPCQHWKSEITLIHILLRTLASWPLYGLSMVFMAFKLKSMAFPTKITPYDPYQLKKLWNFEILGFGLWVWPSKFFWPLKVFLRSLVSKKSSGMQKSYIWAVFHAKQFLMPIFHSGSLWLCAFNLACSFQDKLSIAVPKE